MRIDASPAVVEWLKVAILIELNHAPNPRHRTLRIWVVWMDQVSKAFDNDLCAVEIYAQQKQKSGPDWRKAANSLRIIGDSAGFSTRKPFYVAVRIPLRSPRTPTVVESGDSWQSPITPGLSVGTACNSTWRMRHEVRS